MTLPNQPPMAAPSDTGLRRLVDSNIAGVFISDFDGRVLEANPAFLSMLNYNQSDLHYGQLNWRKLTPAHYQELDREILRDLRQGRVRDPVEREFLCRGGRRLPVLVGMVGLEKKTGPRQLVAFVVNLSDQHRLEQQLLEIADHQKQQLGQDLHDGLSQQISGIKFQTVTLARQLRRESHPAAGHLDELVQLLSQAEDSAHNLARGLHPLRQDKTGLADALEELGILMSQLYRRPCEFRLSKPVPVPDPQVAMHLYRIAQEATGNAMKHGKPSNVLISLSERRNIVTLKIHDNGIGFAENHQAASNSSMGLDIMRYRARLIGSHLRIQSQPGRGTTVTCDWPRSSQNPAAGRHPSASSHVPPSPGDSS